jgi:hypothetical protein
MDTLESLLMSALSQYSASTRLLPSRLSPTCRTRPASGSFPELLDESAIAWSLAAVNARRSMLVTFRKSHDDAICSTKRNMLGLVPLCYTRGFIIKEMEKEKENEKNVNTCETDAA